MSSVIQFFSQPTHSFSVKRVKSCSNIFQRCSWIIACKKRAPPIKCDQCSVCASCPWHSNWNTLSSLIFAPSGRAAVCVCLLHNARGSFHLFRRRWSTAANNFIPGQVQLSCAQNTPIKLLCSGNAPVMGRNSGAMWGLLLTKD